MKKLLVVLSAVMLIGTMGFSQVKLTPFKWVTAADAYKKYKAAEGVLVVFTNSSTYNIVDVRIVPTTNVIGRLIDDGKGWGASAVDMEKLINAQIARYTGAKDDIGKEELARWKKRLDSFKKEKAKQYANDFGTIYAKGVNAFALSYGWTPAGVYSIKVTYRKAYKGYSIIDGAYGDNNTSIYGYNFVLPVGYPMGQLIAKGVAYTNEIIDLGLFVPEVAFEVTNATKNTKVLEIYATTNDVITKVADSLDGWTLVGGNINPGELGVAKIVGQYADCGFFRLKARVEYLPYSEKSPEQFPKIVYWVKLVNDYSTYGRDLTGNAKNEYKLFFKFVPTDRVNDLVKNVTVSIKPAYVWVTNATPYTSVWLFLNAKDGIGANDIVDPNRKDYNAKQGIYDVYTVVNKNGANSQDVIAPWKMYKFEHEMVAGAYDVTVVSGPKGNRYIYKSYNYDIRKGFLPYPFYVNPGVTNVMGIFAWTVFDVSVKGDDKIQRFRDQAPLYDVRIESIIGGKKSSKVFLPWDEFLRIYIAAGSDYLNMLQDANIYTRTYTDAAIKDRMYAWRAFTEEAKSRATDEKAIGNAKGYDQITSAINNFAKKEAELLKLRRLGY